MQTSAMAEVLKLISIFKVKNPKYKKMTGYLTLKMR